MDTERAPSAVDQYVDFLKQAHSRPPDEMEHIVSVTLAHLLWLLVSQYEREYPDCPETTYNVVWLSPCFHRMIGSTYHPNVGLSCLRSYFHAKGIQPEDVMHRVDYDVEIIAQRCMDMLQGKTTLDRLEMMLDMDGA